MFENTSQLSVQELMSNSILFQGKRYLKNYMTMKVREIPHSRCSPIDLELTPMLEVVDMPNNIIKKIPAGIGKAQHLRKLNLTGNDIAKVPKTVGKLKVGLDETVPISYKWNSYF